LISDRVITRSIGAKVTHGKGRRTKQPGKGGSTAGPKKKTKRSNTANKRAEAEIADLIDPRLTKALAHPLRCSILAVANARIISPSDYSEEYEAPLSNVSYHFRKLVEFDCIELVEEVPVRGSHEHRYRGSRRGLVADADWAQLGKGTQAGVRIAGFQDLITRCTQAVEAETFDSREDAVFYWIGGGLDETGWRNLTAAIRRLIGEVSDFEVESAQRAADGEGALFSTTFGVLGFESPKRGSRKRRKRAKAKSKKKAGR
jgi:hypothetical protein